jgi:hypothetical protein
MPDLLAERKERNGTHLRTIVSKFNPTLSIVFRNHCERILAHLICAEAGRVKGSSQNL